MGTKRETLWFWGGVVALLPITAIVSATVPAMHDNTLVDFGYGVVYGALWIGPIALGWVKDLR